MASSMLANYVAELCNSPGTGDFSLAGAATGRMTFASRFANAAQCYYFVTDGTSFEAGIGTLTIGTPNVLARTTVLDNSNDTTDKINFTSVVTVYCDAPAQKLVTLDTMPVNLSLTGYCVLPNGLIIQWGTTEIAVGGSSVSFNEEFPNAVFGVVSSFIGGAAGTTVVQEGTPTRESFGAYLQNGTTQVDGFIAWIALGR